MKLIYEELAYIHHESKKEKRRNEEKKEETIACCFSNSANIHMKMIFTV